MPALPLQASNGAASLLATEDLGLLGELARSPPLSLVYEHVARR